MDDIIQEQYSKIIQGVQGSTLFGERIDIDNEKMVAVAFYYLAQQTQREKDFAESNHRVELLFAEKGLR